MTYINTNHYIYTPGCLMCVYGHVFELCLSPARSNIGIRDAQPLGELHLGGKKGVHQVPRGG